MSISVTFPQPERRPGAVLVSDAQWMEWSLEVFLQDRDGQALVLSAEGK